MAKRLPARTSDVYQRKEKLPRWNVPANPLMSNAPGTLLANRLPSWTKQDHLDATEKHRKKTKQLDARWQREWEKAFHKKFGRAPVVGDYRVSGVGRSEFSQKVKDQLRELAHTGTFHAKAAHAHERAAKVAARRKPAATKASKATEAFTPEYRQLSANPPRVGGSAGIFVIEVYSPAVGGYIAQGSHTTIQAARADLPSWEHAHESALRALKARGDAGKAEGWRPSAGLTERFEATQARDHLAHLRRIPVGSKIAIYKTRYKVVLNNGPKGPHDMVEVGLEGPRGAGYFLYLPKSERHVVRLWAAGRKGRTREASLSDIKILDNPGHGKKTKPKFKLGQWVADLDGGRPGEISFVGEYDDHMGGYRYKVLTADGERKYRNGPGLKKIRKPSGTDKGGHLAHLRRLPAGSKIAIHKRGYTVHKNTGPQGPHDRVALYLEGGRGAAYSLGLPKREGYMATLFSAGGAGSTKNLSLRDIKILDNPGHGKKGRRQTTLGLPETGFQLVSPPQDDPPPPEPPRGPDPRQTTIGAKRARGGAGPSFRWIEDMGDFEGIAPDGTAYGITEMSNGDWIVKHWGAGGGGPRKVATSRSLAAAKKQAERHAGLGNSSGGVEVELIRSKHGPTYKAKISGAVGKIGVRGESLDIHLGLHPLTLRLIKDVLPEGRLRRSDGSGKSLPPATRLKVEKALLQKLKLEAAAAGGNPGHNPGHNPGGGGGSLHERVARVLGWPVADTRSVSLQYMRDMVRPLDPQLAREISETIQSGSHIKQRGNPGHDPGNGGAGALTELRRAEAGQEIKIGRKQYTVEKNFGTTGAPYNRVELRLKGPRGAVYNLMLPAAVGFPAKHYGVTVEYSKEVPLNTLKLSSPGKWPGTMTAAQRKKLGGDPSGPLPPQFTVSLAEMKRRNRAFMKKRPGPPGTTWFDPGAMSWFNTKVHGSGMRKGKNVYFVASHQFDRTTPRFYIIERLKADGSTESYGGPAGDGQFGAEHGFPNVKAAQEHIQYRISE